MPSEILATELRPPQRTQACDLCGLPLVETVLENRPHECDGEWAAASRAEAVTEQPYSE